MSTPPEGRAASASFDRLGVASDVDQPLVRAHLEVLALSLSLNGCESRSTRSSRSQGHGPGDRRPGPLHVSTMSSADLSTCLCRSP